MQAVLTGDQAAWDEMKDIFTWPDLMMKFLVVLPYIINNSDGENIIGAIWVSCPFNLKMYKLPIDQ